MTIPANSVIQFWKSQDGQEGTEGRLIVGQVYGVDPGDALLKAKELIQLRPQLNNPGVSRTPPMNWEGRSTERAENKWYWLMPMVYFLGAFSLLILGLQFWHFTKVGVWKPVSISIYDFNGEPGPPDQYEGLRP